MGREGSTNITRHLYKQLRQSKLRVGYIKVYPYNYVYGSDTQYQLKYRVTERHKHTPQPNMTVLTL